MPNAAGYSTGTPREMCHGVPRAFRRPTLYLIRTFKENTALQQFRDGVSVDSRAVLDSCALRGYGPS